jgi:hypothetical protein
MDLLTTYTPDSLVQAITALPPISTIHKSSQHPLSPLPACVYTIRSLATASNSGYSSASRVPVLSTVSSTELTWMPKLSSLKPPGTGHRRKPRFQQYFHCCMRIRCRGNVFTLWLHSSCVEQICHNTVMCRGDYRRGLDW